MKYILIADAGSTKVEWALLNSDGSLALNFKTEGLNALLASLPQVELLLEEVKAKLPADASFFEFYYYGSGCATPEICSKMETAIRDKFDVEKVYVTTDLLGCARALFGDSKGVACILGTGSNSCLYDGNSIVSNVPSLGFILGDEGSGAALGKRLVSDAFKGLLPENVRTSFLETYNLSLTEILDKVYRSPAPNKFLASLVPFLSEHLWNPYVYSLVLKEFTLFVQRNVAMYKGIHSMPIGFTGSIAAHFGKILKEAVSSQGFELGKVMADPMTGLIDYHAARLSGC